MRAAELGASALFVTRDDSLQLEIQVCPGFATFIDALRI